MPDILRKASDLIIESIPDTRIFILEHICELGKKERFK
jgi:hypothetical protein